MKINKIQFESYIKKLTIKILKESDASDEAKQKGLDYAGFGRYTKNGKVVAKSKNGKLINVKDAKSDNKTKNKKPVDVKSKVDKAVTAAIEGLKDVKNKPSQGSRSSEVDDMISIITLNLALKYQLSRDEIQNVKERMKKELKDFHVQKTENPGYIKKVENKINSKLKQNGKVIVAAHDSLGTKFHIENKDGKIKLQSFWGGSFGGGYATEYKPVIFSSTETLAKAIKHPDFPDWLEKNKDVEEIKDWETLKKEIENQKN